MRRFIRARIFAAALPLITGLPAYSQIFSFGAKVGVPLASAYVPGSIADGAEFTNERRFTAGPTVEAHLPFHLSVEVDALWRRSSYNVNGGFTNPYESSMNDWQVPLIVKYEAGRGPARPFVDAGVVYRHVSSSLSFDQPHHPNTAGVAVGGGMTLKLPHLRLSPEIRYTGWPTQAFESGYNTVPSTSNQVDFLVGITF